MAINLWAARLERPLTEQETVRLMQLLPPKRKERLLRIPEEKQREPLCAYLMLCLALWELYQWRGLPEIAETSMGKPYFPDSAWHFSISHTKSHVFCALADCSVGIDAEELTRKVDLRLADKILSPTERAEFDGAEDKKRAFLTPKTHKNEWF